MAKLQDFSPAQIEEATKWFTENVPDALKSDIRVSTLFNIYFKLKRTPFPLKPNEFIIGVDYKNSQDIISGKELANLSFRNPHLDGKADQFAKDFLIAQLSKL